MGRYKKKIPLLHISCLAISFSLLLPELLLRQMALSSSCHQLMNFSCLQKMLFKESFCRKRKYDPVVPVIEISVSANCQTD